MKFLKSCASSPVLAALLFMIGCALLAQGPAPAQVWKWSKTPASNGVSDPNINWQEGMPPSAVNDSARAMMAALAGWRDDTSGLLLDTGSASAYAVTSNQGFASTPNNGQLLVFVPANTNAVGVTLSADGGSAFAIQGPLGTAIGAGVMIAGTPYEVTFNSANSVWVLRQFVGNPFNVPLGAVLDYTGTTAPNSNFVLPVGQAISRTTFAAYFSLVSTTFGAGNGTTTFNVPDLRSYALVGLDNLGGSAANRLTSAGSGCTMTSVGATCGTQNKTITQANLPNYNLTVTDPQHSHNFSYTSPTTAGVTFAAGTNLGNVTNNATTAGASTGISVNSGGSGTALAIVQPTFGVAKILRIF